MILDVTIQRTFAGFTLDVAFATPHGITALLGPSGAGKSLTLRAIAGLLRPDRGCIAIGDRVLYDGATGIDLPARDRGVGVVFQQYALFPHLTAAENVAFGVHALARDARRARVDETLAVMGLSALAHRKPRMLSGGQQQRVALARAIAPGPSLLLLDEPLSALDIPLRRRLGAELRALHDRTGIPMVLITHDPAEAEAIANSIVRIDGGRVVEVHAV